MYRVRPVARRDSSLASLMRCASPPTERGRLLADVDVAEADARQRLQLVADRRHGLEELRALLHRHVEHVGDRLVLELHLQRLAVVALALAFLAGDVDVGQEVHLDLDDAVALAGLAAPALDVEGEAARLVAARLGLGQAREPLADGREGAGVGGRVGARRAADRRLVDVDHLVEVLQALDAVVLARVLARVVEAARHGLVERVDQQRGLAAAGHAGDAGQQAQRHLGRHVLQVVGSRAPTTVSDLPLRLRRVFGIGIWRTPVRYWPVTLSALAMISSGVPWATTWPP